MVGDEKHPDEFDLWTFDDRDELIAFANQWIADNGSIDDHDSKGVSLLWLAAFLVRDDAVEALLALGADPNGDPIPMAAVCWGNGDSSNATDRIVDMLVAAGADTNVRDQSGWSLIHGAAAPYSYGDGFMSSDGPNPAAIAALIRHGADPNTRGPNGTTALMLAKNAGDDAAVALLRAKGATDIS